MTLDRRELLAAAGGSAFLASCRAAAASDASADAPLDRLLAAHAEVLPEAAGAGANHYPMAAEALETLGCERAIDDAWRRDAVRYAGPLPRVGAIDDVDRALGAYDRFGDWLDHFRAALAAEPWRAVLARWAPRLAPGVCAAAFHGAIRTGHAVRALRRRETDARRGELAVALAYWCSRYAELPTTSLPLPAGGDDGRSLADLPHPWLHDDSDVDFFSVTARLSAIPVAPEVTLAPNATSPAAELATQVRDCATAFLEMLVLEQQRIWLLHTVTGPGAVGMLLPEVDDATARMLVGYARQAAVAMLAAFGVPFAPRAHVRREPAPWPGLIAQAAGSGSVHTVKLVEALVRFDDGDDPLWRSVAEQWLEWR